MQVQKQGSVRDVILRGLSHLNQAWQASPQRYVWNYFFTFRFPNKLTEQDSSADVQENYYQQSEIKQPFYNR